jgi:hypothetical protein
MNPMTSEKRVIWAKHNRRTDDNCVCECAQNCQFAFATLSNVQRSRTRIRADTGKMDKVLDPGLSRLNCYSSGSFDVHGIECLVSVVNIENSEHNARSILLDMLIKICPAPGDTSTTINFQLLLRP